MSTDQAALDRLAAALVAVSAAWNSPAARAGGGEVARVHAERRPGGVLLRLSDVADGRSVEVVLDAADARDLGGYLTRGR